MSSSKSLEVIIAIIIGFAVFVLSSTSQFDINNNNNSDNGYFNASPLMANCDACGKFLPMLLEVTGQHGTSEMLSEKAASEACSRLPAEHQKSCHTISTAFGLHNVDLLLTTAPDLLCAAVSQCESQAESMGLFNSDDNDNSKVTKDADVLVAEGNDMITGQDDSSLGNGVMDNGMDLSGNVALGTGSSLTESSLDSAKNPLATLRKMMQQRQMMQMQMQQQQMMQMQMMRMRLMNIMSSNREMKGRMNHMRRHIPGNCDCCQACPPPPEFAPA